MKKHNLAEFFKSKSFYALLCVGALAIMAITMVGLNQSSEKNKNNNLVDLNEPIVSDVADNGNNGQDQSDTDNASPEDTANQGGSNQSEVAQGDTNIPVTDGSLLEFDVEEDPNGTASNAQSEAAAGNESTQAAAASEAAKAEEAKPVMNPESLYFSADKGLRWPVSGNVLMNYSMDRVIYFETLAQFKVNPAIIIDAKVGTDVLCAAKGIVTSIEEDAETGKTVTAAIGSGYSVVYGQLKDITVEVGDTINEGDVIGTIAEPTKYYSLEGSNLYLQVLKDEKTINPMSLLR